MKAIQPYASSSRMGVKAYGGKQGSGPSRPKSQASFRRLHDTEVVTAVWLTVRSGHREAPRRMYAFHLYGALRVKVK
jgi:hypothetical protein